MNLSKRFYEAVSGTGSFDDNSEDAENSLSSCEDEDDNQNVKKNGFERNHSFSRKVRFFESMSQSPNHICETVPEEEPEEIQTNSAEDFVCQSNLEEESEVMNHDEQTGGGNEDELVDFVEGDEEEDEVSFDDSDDSWDQNSEVEGDIAECARKEPHENPEKVLDTGQTTSDEANGDLTWFDPVQIVKPDVKESKEETMATLELLLQHVEHNTKDGVVADEVYSEMETYWASRMKDRMRWKNAVSRLINLRRLPTHAPEEEDQVDAPGAPDALVLDEMTMARWKKLFLIANEILQTEREYVKALRHLAVTLHKKVEKENRKKPMFEEEMIPRIFLNIQSVFAFHDQFMLPKLEERIVTWHKQKGIGDVMKQCAPFLKLDAEYVRKYDQCMKDVKDLKKKCRRFRRLIERFEAKILQKQDWWSVSLQPVQRVPRYVLLLQRYIDNLPDDSSDMKDAKDALRITESVACHSNETIRKHDDANRLLEMSKRISGLKEELFINNRKFIMQDDVCVIDPRSGDSLHRHVIMFSDILLACHPLSVMNNTYRVIDVIPFKDTMVIEGANASVPHTLFISAVKLTLEFAFRSQAAKNAWKKEMEAQVSQTNKGSEMKPLRSRRVSMVVDTIGLRAPICVRFRDVKKCMSCQKEFSLLIGKNHCRACGMVVCGQCSAHQIKLPYLDDSVERVCDKCFVPLLAKLERRRSEAVLPTYTLPRQQPTGQFKRRLATTRRTMNRTKSDWYTE